MPFVCNLKKKQQKNQNLFKAKDFKNVFALIFLETIPSIGLKLRRRPVKW